jgi:hypothetical protein
MGHSFERGEERTVVRENDCQRQRADPSSVQRWFNVFEKRPENVKNRRRAAGDRVEHCAVRKSNNKGYV